MRVILLNDGMGKIPATAINERREKVWFMMLKGHNPQSIIKTLGTTKTVVYNDINFLTEKSKQYMYDMAKGTHVLMYQRAVEGISLTLAQAWDKFNDPTVPEKQKVAYLRLTKECNEKMFEFTANGPTEMAVLDIMRRADKLGIDYDHKPVLFSEQEQIRNYIKTNPRLNGSYIDVTRDSYTTSKDKDDLNNAPPQ
ncbi:MAG TPA: hypothetical protein VFI73_03360 [Candidatus Nitrosopolaris sp.]|nr:hypothetical protein [Candidatus Nitrosopolaris sp.]